MKALLSSMAVAGLLACHATGVRAAEPAAGDDAPEFSLAGSDGKTYDLADFKDKQAVVVAWFPKAFTGG
jgi:thioredoxin-dependent peroxiredoxin